MDKIANIHMAGMDYKIISRLGEKVATVAEIIWKWKKYKMVISCPRMRIVHGLTLYIMLFFFFIIPEH